MRCFRHLSVLRAVAFLALCLAVAAPANAQWQANDEADENDIELKIHDSRAARFWAGAAAGMLGTTAGVGTAAAVANIGCEHASDGCGIYALVYAIPSVAVAIPSFTAGAVTWIGARRGVNGSYGFTWLGSTAGMLTGAATGIGLSIGSGYRVSPLWTVPMAIFGASTGALIAHNRSARSRFADALGDIRPSLHLTDDRQGAMLSASGTF